MILTSNFYHLGSIPQAFAISRGVPRGWTGRRYPPLAPSQKAFKIKEEGVFLKVYRAETLDKLDPYAVIKDMGGDDFVMLCWERPSEFCHRRVVAAWIRKHTGLLIEEFNPKLRRHAEWLRRMREGK